MRKAGRRPIQRAFTLVEMLVVIAIVSLLAALLSPALRKARDQARQIACLNNLKQLGVAFSAYAAENNGLLPPYRYGVWPGRLGFQIISPYLGKTSSDSFGYDYLRCPSRPPDGTYTYGMSIPMFGDGNAGGFPKQDQVPSNVYLAGDAGPSPVIYSPAYYSPSYAPFVDTDGDNVPDTNVPLPQYNELYPIHSRGANFLFGDMHVGWVSLLSWARNENGLWGSSDADAYH